MADEGTMYESSNPGSVEVSEDGILTVQEDAKSGENVTITVTNGDKIVKVMVKIISIKSISVSAKKKIVSPAEKLPLTVKATLSDRSRLDITKGKETTYALEDDTYATIDDDGLLVVKDEEPKGTAIKAEVENRRLTAEYVVTVK